MMLDSGGNRVYETLRCDSPADRTSATSDIPLQAKIRLLWVIHLKDLQYLTPAT